jgi:hypothetical protein
MEGKKLRSFVRTTYNYDEHWNLTSKITKVVDYDKGTIEIDVEDPNIKV